MRIRNIQKNLENIFGKIKDKDIQLAAVTKKRTIPEIKQAIFSGVKIIAENRAGEAKEKYSILKEFLKKNNIKYHFIGHIQSNKAKDVVEFADLIHTLDSEKLAKKLDKYTKKNNKIQKILVQVNIGKEPQKYGIEPEKTREFIEKISKFKNLKIQGLMCLSPYFEDPEKTRPYFKKMKDLFDELKSSSAGKYDMKYLSMGTSFSYSIAIEEGANLIRVGTKIFE
ncbi:YggS family pyridoxal phosphate-dependent enzyme [Candidatus Woesearchaeota archaeon]|nr:YggS family pyridoxal phosphate-dependent enzyme [Candidatus Woesearchaeota archaeon]